MVTTRPITATLSAAERAAWTFILSFVRHHAAAIASAGWCDDVTDRVLSAILSTPHLLELYLLAIAGTDAHVHGNRRKALLDQQIGRTSKAASRGVVRVENGRKLMRSASVGPHFTYTVLDAPTVQVVP